MYSQEICASATASGPLARKYSLETARRAVARSRSATALIVFPYKYSLPLGWDNKLRNASATALNLRSQLRSGPPRTEVHWTSWALTCRSERLKVAGQIR